MRASPCSKDRAGRLYLGDRMQRSTAKISTGSAQRLSDSSYCRDPPPAGSPLPSTPAARHKWIGGPTAAPPVPGAAVRRRGRGVPARREETGIAAAAAAAADWRISVGGFGVSKLEESVRAEQEPRAVLFSFFFCAIFFSDLDYSDSLVGPQRAPFEWPNGAFFRNFEWGFAIIFYLFFHKITKIDDASKISQNYTITDMSHGGREL